MTLYYSDDQVTLHQGDALDVARTLPDGSADCIVTSPPYFGLRDYGTEGQYGLEASPAEYVETMRALFAELRRVLADDGTLWVNLGDSYNAYNGNRGASRTGFSRNEPLPDLPKGAGLTVKTLPPKNLLGVPWRIALALQDDGWILRNDVIWSKPNAMPESVTDRLSSRHEYLFLLTKKPRYYFDLDAIREAQSEATVKRLAAGPVGIRRDQSPGEEREARLVSGLAKGRNPGDVWEIATQPFPGAHFAVFPIALPQRCILAGCKPGGTVLDPFNGSGTTGLAAQRTGRKYIGIDINREYLDLTLSTRLRDAALDFGEGA